MKQKTSHKPLAKGIALVLAISLFNQTLAHESQAQDHGGNYSSTTTTDYDQQPLATTAATQLADSQLEIDSRETRQPDEAAPSRQSQVVRQSSGSYATHEQQDQLTSSGGGSRRPLQRNSSRPNLARLRADGGNYQLANYSQPFDVQPASIFYRNHLTAAGGEHPLPSAATGRALNSAAPSSSAVVGSPASYTYISAPSQRFQQSTAATTATTSGAEIGVGPSSLMLDEPHSYGQESLLDGYTPPLQHAHSVVVPSRVQYYPQHSAAATAATTGSGRHSAMLSGDNLAHFMASPSMNLAGYDDYPYGIGSASEYGGDHYNLARAPFSYYNNTGGIAYDNSFGYPHYATESASSSLQSDSYHHRPPSRSRWSWPWTDVSSYAGDGGYLANRDHSGLLRQPMTSATFKKHYHHHHHLPAKHKEHDHHHHHEEHESLMPKWEHGISIGEIACIAVAVVLGIIILGSPFFLLFLMLFNGGNLFGTTQMGLLAPATVQGGTAAVAGRRRRRKRSLDIPLGSGDGLNAKDMEAKYKEHGVYGVTEYLFEKLSPFLDSGKLLQSFERMMDVKDDIEKIVTKLAKHEESNKATAGWTGGSDQQQTRQHQHSEMRRKKRR